MPCIITGSSEGRLEVEFQGESLFPAELRFTSRPELPRYVSGQSLQVCRRRPGATTKDIFVTVSVLFPHKLTALQT
jgi:hypothetical protein